MALYRRRGDPFGFPGPGVRVRKASYVSDRTGLGKIRLLSRDCDKKAVRDGNAIFSCESIRILNDPCESADGKRNRRALRLHLQAGR